MTAMIKTIAAFTFGCSLFAVSVGLFALGGGIQATSLSAAHAVTVADTNQATH